MWVKATGRTSKSKTRMGALKNAQPAKSWASGAKSSTGHNLCTPKIFCLAPQTSMSACWSSLRLCWPPRVLWHRHSNLKALMIKRSRMKSQPIRRKWRTSLSIKKWRLILNSWMRLISFHRVKSKLETKSNPQSQFRNLLNNLIWPK